jgi:AAA domain
MTEPRVPLVVRLADVAPEDVDWLWEPYIPRRKLTILEGDPGAGKTWLALTIAASVSRGDPFPNKEGVPLVRREPAPVLYLSAEDGLADTLRPRLDAAAADVTRVHALLGWQQGETQGCISLGDLLPIEQALKDLRPALMVIDPLQAYLGARVDMHRANEVRPLLSGLAALAEQYECAVLAIRHLSKAPQDRAVKQGLGSIDFAAAARSILLAGQDPRQPSRCVMAHTKSSLAPRGDSLGYELREGHFFWTGTSDVSAEDLLRPYPVDEERSAVEEAADFLCDFLAEGEKPAKEVVREAKKAGISEITLKRARKGRVHARKAQVAGEEKGKAPWVWSLKEDHDPQRPDDPLYSSRKTLKNQELPGEIKEDHMTLFNGNGNNQQKHRLMTEFKEDHRVPLGAEHPSDDHDHLDRWCAGCHRAFVSLTDGSSKTLCRVCQAELRRGMRR